MTYKRLVKVLAALLFWGLLPVHADPLIIYTENYPPYNLLDDDGEVVGLATEKVRQVMASSGLEYEIRLVPWSRAVHYTQNNSNALVYSITRTPARERKFDWLVPLAESSFYVFNREKDIRVIDLESIKSGAYTGACVSSDLGCELFRAIGMPNDKILRIADNETADFRMVVAERADLYISDINVNARLRLSEGFDPMLTKPVLRLEGKTGFYLAGGAKLDPAIRDGIVSTYKSLMRANAYQLADPQKLQTRLSR